MSEKQRILLGVTGSIAAFKAVELASLLTKEGFAVDVVMTAEAQQFIQPLSFAAITHEPVVTNLWDEHRSTGPTHIGLADRASLVVIAPATAHILAQMAHGLASDALTSVLLATEAPVIVAPAMNGKMWLHTATQANVATLKSRKVEFIGPEAGMLACGYQGIGRLWPVAQIAQRILKKLGALRKPAKAAVSKRKK